MSNQSSTHIIWIIEDNAAFRSNLSETLNDTNNIRSTRDFSSCEEAIQHLPKARKIPQLILMDLSLPGITGIEGIQKIKSNYPEMLFIVLTGSDQQQDVFNAIMSGANGYMLKNTSIDQIIHGIEDVMSGGASLDPHIASMVLNAFPKNDKQPKEHDLTDREVEVLELLAEGKAIKEISDSMNLSSHTIKFHVANTYKYIKN